MTQPLIDEPQPIIELSSDYNLFSELTFEGILIHDEGIIIKANYNMARMLGFDSADDLTGKNALLFLTPESVKIVESKLKNDNFEPYEVQAYKTDGTLIHTELNARKVLYNGKIMRAVAIRDISNCKEYIKSLSQAKLAAEHANTVKSELIANISHDIRTPMNAIIGMCEVLLMSAGLDRQAVSNIEVIKQSANSLLMLINDILDMSKMESGLLELENTEFNLNDLIEQILSMFNLQAANKGIKLYLSLDAAMPQIIKGDAERLKQILVNLIGNAFKFTEKGEITISANLIAFSGDKVEISFCVSDTGIGIEADKLDRIFDRFTQADGTVSKKFGGSGLGLAICKILAGKMGGNIWAESVLGQGSSFYFTCRFETADNKTGKGTANLTSASHRVLIADDKSVVKQAAVKPLKILLVEDNLFNQQVASKLLQLRGHDVSIANNGLIAIKLLEQKHFDIVLMDIQMPVLDGIQTTRMIRSGSSPKIQKDIAIIAMTASAMTGDREQCIASGMNAYIPKPLDSARLYEIVEKFGNLPAQNDDTPHLNAAAEGCVNMAAALKRLGYIEELYEEVCSLFIKNADNYLLKMKAAAAESDFNKLSRDAHSLKSLSGSAGAEILMDCCLQIEKATIFADQLIKNAAAESSINCGICIEDKKTEIDILLKKIEAEIKTAVNYIKNITEEKKGSFLSHIGRIN